MQRYQCHKVVEAGKILSMNGLEVTVSTGDGAQETHRVPDNFYARGWPNGGDYLVKYEPDGYLSWSPKDTFERGYTKV